jgi:2-C-methyl-D-erythritol 2,4-cyclodiphosphate synthase
VIDTRIGSGFDVHQLVEGRPLMLGGVHIPHSKGLDGHSDGDVLLHAIGDALLGAAALGDIGKYFPSGDPSLKGIYSKKILARILRMVKEAGFAIGNVDATVVLQSPKIMDFIPAMRETISGILDVEISRVSVKATTTDRLGFTGREEGIAAEAVVLLYFLGTDPLATT